MEKDHLMSMTPALVYAWPRPINNQNDHASFQICN